MIDKNAALKYCSERDGDCVEWRKPITTGKWYFASVVLRHAAPGYELHMRLSTDAESLPHAWDGAPVDKVSSDTFTLVVKSGVALGAKFNGPFVTRGCDCFYCSSSCVANYFAGRIDLLSLSFKKRSAASDGDFSEGEIVQVRRHDMACALRFIVIFVADSFRCTDARRDRAQHAAWPDVLLRL